MKLLHLLCPWLRPLPKIPHGFTVVTRGRTQKGDGRYNGRRFLKVKPEFPLIRRGEIIIRPLAVTQPDLPLHPDAS